MFRRFHDTTSQTMKIYATSENIYKSNMTIDIFKTNENNLPNLTSLFKRKTGSNTLADPETHCKKIATTVNSKYLDNRLLYHVVNHMPLA